MKYTVTVDRTANNTNLQRKVVLRAAPSEVTWHIALKILGYILFLEYDPLIEQGIGWHFKPDLVALDEQGNLRLWVDCGNIAVRKIDRVAQKVGKQAPFFILRRSWRDASLLNQMLKGKMRHPERLRILSFDAGFVDTLASHLDVTNAITAVLGEEHLELRVENRNGLLHTTTVIAGQHPQ